MLDLTPATTMVTRVITDARDDQLGAPTPCQGVTVADLLNHVDGLSVAFTGAAAKDRVAGSQAPSASGTRLGPDWRVRISRHLAELADAWHDEAAWTGMTLAGGLEMPAEVAGHVAINEVLVHGWDIAVATGHDYASAPDLVDAASEFVAPTVAQNPVGSPGLFGPPVAVPEDAMPLDKLIGLTGRDPRWHPGED